jgi:V/A-type H+-transporting ATPase subunit D
MSDVSPTRSAVIELKDERRAMHEGYVFLDEKCLLLAGEILLELARFASLQAEFLLQHGAALTALQAAVARHGLQGLQIYPPADLSAGRLHITPRTLMGVALQQAELLSDWTTDWTTDDGDGMPPTALPATPPDAVQPSPEAAACRLAFATVLARAAVLAAVSGNLERLSLEYQRAVRRARALQDVMLPELDRSIADIESRLEELEQEDAIWMRQGAGA